MKFNLPYAPKTKPGHSNLKFSKRAGKNEASFLYADTASRRPGFLNSAQPDLARQLFNLFVAEVKKSGLKVATGRFGKYMQVEIHNDGPVTIILEN